MSGSSGRARYLHRLLAEQAGVTLGFYARANGDEWQRNNCYSVPRQILRTCARQLQGLPVLFVGVRCPVEVAMERRRATWGGVGYNLWGARSPIVTVTCTYGRGRAGRG